MRKNKDTPAGMDHGRFLCASPETVESLLTLEDDNLPNTKSAFWRDDAPSLLVVMEAVEVHTHGDEEDEYDTNGPNDEGKWYKSVFKVPVEIIVDSLRDPVDVPFIPPSRLTRQVKGSAELGGAIDENCTEDGLTELWWGGGTIASSSPEETCTQRTVSRKIYTIASFT